LAVSFEFNAKKSESFKCIFLNLIYTSKKSSSLDKEDDKWKINIGGLRGNLKNITKRKYIKSGDVDFLEILQ
jgi:hypothetical protein